MLRIADLHAAEFAFPAVKGLFGNVVFSNDLCYLFPVLLLFQYPDDLFLGKPCLHVNHSIFLFYHIVTNIPTDEVFRVQVSHI